MTPLRLVFIILVILLLLGALPVAHGIHPFGYSSAYGGGFLLVILIILLLVGVI